jgi:hypothetical protein
MELQENQFKLRVKVLHLSQGNKIGVRHELVRMALLNKGTLQILCMETGEVMDIKFAELQELTKDTDLKENNLKQFYFDWIPNEI